MYRRLAIGLAALLIAARAAAPPIIAAQLNKRLAEIGEYRGHVEDVDLALLSGGYTLHGLEIEKTSGQVPVPFFRSRRIDMRSSLGGLLRGRAESRFLFDGLQLNFVDAASRAQRQAGEVMTPDPMTVSPGLLAAEALRRMTVGERKITQLFVTDEDGRPVGLLHIHDLLRAGVS